MREERFWEEEEKRKCRLYGWEEETWEHVVEVCMEKEGGSGKEMIVKILDKGGGGEGKIKRIQESRKGGEEGEDVRRTDRGRV